MKQSLRQRNALSDRVAIINQIERETKRKAKITEAIGYVGLVFVQFSIIPNLFFGMAWLMHSSLLVGSMLLSISEIGMMIMQKMFGFTQSETFVALR